MSSYVFSWNDAEKREYTLAEVLSAIRKLGAPDDLSLVKIGYAGCGTHEIEVSW